MTTTDQAYELASAAALNGRRDIAHAIAGYTDGPIFTPDVSFVLDWEFETVTGLKPLRNLNVDELLHLARNFTAIGAVAIADTFAVLAESIPAYGTVSDLNDDTFHHLFWGTKETTV